MMNATFQKSINTSPAEEVFGWKLRRMNLRRKRPSYEDGETRRSFEIGEQVWVKKEMKSKEDYRFEGPATIEKRFNPRAYQLKFEDGRRIRRNVEWLKTFKQGGGKGSAVCLN